MQNLAETSPNLPESNQNMWETSPNPMQNLAETSPNLPESNQNMWETSPNPMQNLAETSPNLPESNQNMWETSPNPMQNPCTRSLAKYSQRQPELCHFQLTAARSVSTDVQKACIETDAVKHMQWSRFRSASSSQKQHQAAAAKASLPAARSSTRQLLQTTLQTTFLWQKLFRVARKTCFPVSNYRKHMQN